MICLIYFQKICMSRIKIDKNKQIPVLTVIPSPNNITDIAVNTTMPIENPISLPGQSCPPLQSNIYLVDSTKSQVIGIPASKTNHLLSCKN